MKSVFQTYLNLLKKHKTQHFAMGEEWISKLKLVAGNKFQRFYFGKDQAILS